MSLVLPVVVLFSTATTALFGWVVYRGDPTLIAGYDPETIADEEGLTRFVGRDVLFVAGVTAVLGVVTLFVKPDLLTMGVSTGLMVLVSLWLVVGTGRFESGET